MSVGILIDSTADVTPEVRKQLTVVPLTIHFGTEEYVDGVTITHKEFYEKLVECDTLPTTSQASPEAFRLAYEEAFKTHEELVVITLASSISGTCQSAVIAAGEFDKPIFVVDSQSVAIGTGILAEHALALAKTGLSAAAIAEDLEKTRDDVCVVAMLDTLEYLKKGGRISAAAAIAGGILSIKPVVSIPKGVITVLGKARGSRQGNNLLVQEIQKAGGVDFARPLLLGYTGMSDTLLTKYTEDSAHLWEGHGDCLRSTVIGSVVGTHAGPGAIAVAFFKKG